MVLDNKLGLTNSAELAKQEELLTKKRAKELFEKLGLVVSKFLDIEVEYLGSVPYDHNMQKAIMKQSPISILDPLSNTARALNKIANQLEQNMEQEEEHYGIVKLFSSVIRMRFMKS